MYEDFEYPEDDFCGDACYDFDEDYLDYFEDDYDLEIGFDPYLGSYTDGC